jgi:hypothetical protein
MYSLFLPVNSYLEWSQKLKHLMRGEPGIDAITHVGTTHAFQSHDKAL